MLNFLSNAVQSKRFVSINNRTAVSDIPESFWYSIAKNNCDINWENIPLQKSPFQIITTQG
ncbi:hypothetical protein [Rickettsia amblyommatis]|uniref:Uncharacterized protein n=1 Tax=Rickettsia amblyommatis (strain GAT-30V) TaxID=1105111 RepID=H8K4B3_RICAG|nr:hypothetical protein [Rickettsia amblyommatis]AFC69357.1 hypothetical protein MCE_01815 [Rickettsia amblyommatis str. GAT-30V]KJV97492.1 hypothetical protein RAMDARK_0404 [Rickettsia amblyommatis str. Darkwater]